MRSIATRTLAVFILSVLGIFFVGCPDKTLRLGAVLPVTGVDQIYGEAIRKGVELAYEEIQNDPSHKTPIELIIVDSQSDPELAAQKLKELYDGGAMGVIGGVTSDEVQAMIDVVDDYVSDRVLLSPSATSPNLTGISRNFYRISPSDYTAATKMAGFAMDSLSLKTYVVIAEQRSYGIGIQNVFREAIEEEGGEVLDVIELPAHAEGEGAGIDFGGILERVMTLDPDAVYLAAYADGVISMIQELRRNEYGGRILTTSAFATPAAIARAGEDAKNVVLTQIFLELDSEHAHVKKFVNGFREKFGEEPDLYAAYGYDSLRVLAAAAEGRPTLPGELHKGLRDTIQEFPGVTGAIQFNEKGDVQRYPRVYLIGEDLGLYDYDERIKRQQQEIKKRQEELRRRLDELRSQADEVG